MSATVAADVASSNVFHFPRVADEVCNDDVRVDVVRDRKGVAGYGVFGLEGDGRYTPQPVMLRKVDDDPLTVSQSAVLQPLPRNLFHRSDEGWMAREFCKARWGDARERSRSDYKAYFGRLAYARRLVNHVIRKALAETNADALAIARRYPTRYRHGTYLLCTVGDRCERVRQLARAFPLAIPAILESKDKTAIDATRAGRKLREVAEIIGIPYAARHLPPVVAPTIAWHRLRVLPNETLYLAPRKSRSARLWARVVAQVFGNSYSVDPVEFIRWLTLRWSEVERLGLGGTVYLHDWARKMAHASEWRRLLVAAEREGINIHRLLHPAGGVLLDFDEQAEQYRATTGVKPFNPRMHAKAALAAAREWHKHILMARLKTTRPLPRPWLPQGKVGEISIVPLTTTAELIEEGVAMAHCVASYADDALRGFCCLYSVRRDGVRIATLELTRRHRGSLEVAQLKGLANAPVSKDVTRAVRRWLRESKRALPSPEPGLVQNKEQDPWDDCPF